MQYTPRLSGSLSPDGLLYDSLEGIAKGLGLSLVEITISRQKGGKIQIRAVIFKKGGTGISDCSAFHRAMLPRLDLAFPGEDLYVEVSSTGIDRLIKDGSEFAYYTGQGIRCYRTDISDWSAGILQSSNEKGIALKGKEGIMNINYEIIAKAKLHSGEV
jgi:ribosome maturation factor RimP